MLKLATSDEGEMTPGAANNTGFTGPGLWIVSFARCPWVLNAGRRFMIPTGGLPVGEGGVEWYRW
jgi:hypothetical protein